MQKGGHEEGLEKNRVDDRDNERSRDKVRVVSY
jgi:hypothetical protein